MGKKINLEEIIKDELYNRHLFFNKINNVQIKNICLEFGKQLLKLAAENAKTEVVQMNICGSVRIVDKQSILNTIKQIK